MDTDSQARQLLDRMAIDFAQMVKRSDVDYYVKSSVVPQLGNDQIAFYSTVPGYYPTPNTTYQGAVSLVAYRVNQNTISGNRAYLKLERMGKGLLWNAAPSPAGQTPPPVVFIPVPLAVALSASPTPSAGPTATATPTASPLPTATATPTVTPAWPEAASATITTGWSDSAEVFGPQVFRFEYYYLLTNGSLSAVPWRAGHNAVSGLQDVAAIVVNIAAIDPKSRQLLSDAQIAAFGTPSSGNFLADYATGMVPGQLRYQWQNTINAITSLPRPALSGIRLYERYFYLSPPALNTP